MQVGEGVTLNDLLLIEDDAPAFGFSVEEDGEEILRKGVVLRKTLNLETWPIRSAHLVMLVYPVHPPEPNNGRHLVFTVNGQNCKPYEVNHFWTNAHVPIEFLREGENQIEVRTYEEDTQFKTFVALNKKYPLGSSTRTVHPNRSARSADDGQTWSVDRLGTQGEVDGEYPIRLSVNVYEPSGWLQSPIIDLPATSNLGEIRPAVEMESVRLDLDHAIPQGTSLRLFVRNGSTHFMDGDRWSDWVECEAGDLPKGLCKNRYLQFKTLFETDDPLASPELSGVTLSTKYSLREDATLDGLSLISSENHPRIQTSFPFQHEDCENEKLQELRRQYDLDAVVAGAGTEFERIRKLQTWVAGRWEWFLPGTDYPEITSWDASQILAQKSDGKPLGGYCLQYAIVLMQTCQSFGIPARIVNSNASVWGGHELVEVWSNDYNKWVLLDAQFDTCFFDRSTETPLNALELHRVFLDHYYPDEVIDRNDWSREDFVRRTQSIRTELPIRCDIGGGALLGTLKDYSWNKAEVELSPYCGGYGFLNMAFIRYLPRSNFLSEPLPMPLNHGRDCHWGWDGYLCWYDDQTPRAQEFRIFTNRENDLYWILNGVDFSAETIAPGKLRIWMDTFSPKFSHFEVIANGEVESVETRSLDWALVAGRNELTMRVVDKMGNLGPRSHLTLNYAP